MNEPKGIPEDTSELKVTEETSPIFEKDVLDKSVAAQSGLFHRLIPRMDGKPTGLSSVEVMKDRLTGHQRMRAEEFIRKAKRSDRKRKQEKASRKKNRRRR